MQIKQITSDYAKSNPTPALPAGGEGVLFVASLLYISPVDGGDREGVKHGEARP